MKISCEIKEGVLVIKPEGRIDAVAAPEFEKYVNENISKAPYVILDCEKLEYIASAGLRVLLAMQKRKKDSMKLINVCELAMEIFEITGFADILVIE